MIITKFSNAFTILALFNSVLIIQAKKGKGHDRNAGFLEQEIMKEDGDKKGPATFPINAHKENHAASKNPNSLSSTSYMPVRHGVYSGSDAVFDNSDEEDDSGSLHSEEESSVEELPPEVPQITIHTTTNKPVYLTSSPKANLGNLAASIRVINHVVEGNNSTYTFKETVKQLKEPSSTHYGNPISEAKVYRPPAILRELKPDELKANGGNLTISDILLSPPPLPNLVEVKQIHRVKVLPGHPQNMWKKCSPYGKSCRKHSECCEHYCHWFSMKCDHFKSDWSF